MIMNSAILPYLSEINANNLLAENEFIEIIKSIDCELPSDYQEFMKLKNGGEGCIGDGAYVIFWKLEELIEANNDYNIPEHLPEIFMIGTDGGGCGFGFNKEDGRFWEVDLNSLSMEDAIEHGADFSGFLKSLSEFVD